MQTPVKIDFQGIDPNPDVRSKIVKPPHPARGALQPDHCRPSGAQGARYHHHKGGLYEVSIRLALPRAVNQY